jgi:branched-chain amino acid transport system permease protein
MSLSLLGQVLVSGLATGAVYGLVAMGYSVIFSATKIFNLAQGQMLMLGVMVTWQARAQWGWPTPTAIVFAVIVAAAINVVVERLAVAPLHPGRNPSAGLATLVTTIGASIVIQGLANVHWGVNEHPFLPYFNPTTHFRLGGVSLSPQQLFMIISAVLIALIYRAFTVTTYWGTGLLAMAEDETAAALRGVPVGRARMLVFAIAGAISAFGGAVIAPVTFADPNLGFNFGLQGFVAVAVGGFDSIVGALAGGMVLGLSESFVANYWNDLYRPFTGLVLVLVVLMLRPQGLLGHARLREV